MPANCITGINVPIITKNMDAIWLLVIVDANSPMPVAKITNRKVAKVKVKKLPFIGTSNKVTMTKHIRK